MSYDVQYHHIKRMMRCEMWAEDSHSSALCQLPRYGCSDKNAQVVHCPWAMADAICVNQITIAAKNIVPSLFPSRFARGISRCGRRPQKRSTVHMQYTHTQYTHNTHTIHMHNMIYCIHSTPRQKRNDGLQLNRNSSLHITHLHHANDIIAVYQNI